MTPSKKDILQVRGALKKMYSYGWSKKQYMNFELQCLKNKGANQDEIEYMKKCFVAADESLRETPLQAVLF